MGTKTLGNTGAGNSAQFWYFSSGNMSIRSNDTMTATEDMYIDSIHVAAATKDGTAATAQAGLYNTAENLLATANAFTLGTVVQYYTASFSAGSFYFIAKSGTFRGGLAESGHGMLVWGRGDGGTWNYTTVYPLPSSLTGSTASGEGNWPWYVTYFPAASVTGIPTTPQFPGATIDVFGTSFTAGVTSVTIAGLGCTGITVVSDTHLTCVLPSNAVTGYVTVNTNAGSDTSSTTLIVSGGRIERSGVLVNTVGVRIVNGGVLKPVTRIRVVNGGVLKDAR